MSLISGKKTQVEAVLFSPLQGHLTFNGKPASRATIKLWLAWEDKKGKNYHFTADENGFFNIPKQTAIHSESSLAQLVISQEIKVTYKGREYEIWSMSKMEPAEFTELGIKPLNLVCELTNEMTTIRGIGSLGGTMCTWESLKN